MGARGPLPLTAHERRLRGAAGAPRTVADVGAPSRPTMPRTLGPEGRAEWRRVTRMLGERGLLDQADRAVIAAYCRTWERWLELDGITRQYAEPTPAGRALTPEWRALRECTQQLLNLAAQLGMTPASRLRLPAPAQEQQADPIVELIRRADRSAG